MAAPPTEETIGGVRVPARLPIPVEKQREVLYLEESGHTVVLGSAGSGKTVIAILRAAYLADTATQHGGPTLLLTFNRTLARYILHLLGGVPPGLTIENYHTFARGYLYARGEMPRSGGICRDTQEFVEQAIATVRQEIGDHRVLRRAPEVFVEEVTWMTQHGIWSEDGYLAAERIGRSEARLTRADRPVVFRVFETYRRLRQARHRYDWDDLPWAVVQAIDADTTARKYKHIVADEVQDFSLPMLMSLSRYVPEGGSLTVFGDAAQQIYGRRLSWTSAGLKIRQAWRLERNYRNSAAIAKLAIAISRMPYYSDVEDLVEPAPAAAQGPNPTLLACANTEVEISRVVAVARERSLAGSVGILTRDRGPDHRRLAKRLPKAHTRLHGKMQAWPAGNGIYLGTIHSAKGVEFDTVILPFLGDHQLPLPTDIENFGHEEASSRDGRLLFVGVTRAKRELLLTHTGEPTKLLPTDSTLYIKVSV